MSPRVKSTGDGARAVNPYETKCTKSWWIAHAQPEQWATFMDAAKTRDAERQHLADLKESKKIQFVRHPGGLPPSSAPLRDTRKKKLTW